ncbi:MAG: RagB/SusD family nutrient uptake outer membrane protein [Prevotella sp.]|nr:RagB/SusD family nutrient uptake outer membrane protein [Prevotella sp.]
MRIKYINIILTFTLLFGAGACTDLEMRSDGRDTLNSIFSNYGKTRTFYLNCLASVPQMGETYGTTFLSSFSDEAQDATDILSTGVSYWYAGSVTPLSNPITLNYEPWVNLYVTIRRCNTFLQSLDDPELATYAFNETEKNGWKAQVRVVRAYAYLQLMKRYGGIPLMDATEVMDIEYDYSQSKRASIEEVADYIIGECDLALSTAESEGQPVGFRWALADSDRGQISRAFAWAVKSETALYAASPLWNPSNSGKYTWSKATEITKAALDACLEHRFKLYDTEVGGNIAQNSYANYFIQRSDPSRQTDRETIYESLYQLSVWRYSGTPVWPGAESAGTCPSQELVDAYETIDGQPVLNLDKPYNDADHLEPNYNQANQIYNPANPYANRDPRFYASIYYNGAPRTLTGAGKTAIYYMNFSERVHEAINAIDLTLNDDGSATIAISDGTVDPWIYTSALEDKLPLNARPYRFVFEYKSNKDVPDAQFFFGFGGGVWGGVQTDNNTIPRADDWSTFEFRLDEPVFGDLIPIDDWGWGTNPDAPHYLRFDPTTGVSDYEITIRNMRVECIPPETSSGVTVDTYVDGNCGLRSDDQRYTRTGYYLRKYNNHRSNVDIAGDGYMKMYRLAELYLNFAEAAYNSAGPDVAVGGMTAREAVNIIRSRAGMPGLPAGMSQETFEKRYRNERRIEMAFEEQRFFDVRRWKILGETDGFVTAMRITKKGSTFKYTREKLRMRYCNTDKFLMFPINQSEVTKMNALTGTEWQNPGW